MHSLILIAGYSFLRVFLAGTLPWPRRSHGVLLQPLHIDAWFRDHVLHSHARNFLNIDLVLQSDVQLADIFNKALSNFFKLFVFASVEL